MNGVHDLGGMHGFGPVEAEPDEPVFHHDWERRVFAMLLACGALGKWNIDTSRHSREKMPPAAYLAASYYERWLYGLELLLSTLLLVSREELEARMHGRPHSVSPIPGVRALSAVEVGTLVRRRHGSKVDEKVAPRFEVGDRVVTRNINPIGHTRLPRYARGKAGVITADHGVWVFPDAAGNGLGDRPQHCYSVRFAASELWGEAATARDSVCLDLWDDHLEPA